MLSLHKRRKSVKTDDEESDDDLSLLKLLADVASHHTSSPVEVQYVDWEKPALESKPKAESVPLAVWEKKKQQVEQKRIICSRLFAILRFHYRRARILARLAQRTLYLYRRLPDSMKTDAGWWKHMTKLTIEGHQQFELIDLARRFKEEPRHINAAKYEAQISETILSGRYEWIPDAKESGEVTRRY